MADKKTGPVKPPVIDAKARAAEGEDEKKPATDTPGKEQGKTAGAASARETGTSAPRTESASPSSGKTRQAGKTGAPKAGTGTPAAEKPARPAAAGTLVATGLGGAVLGLALAYGAATLGLWPGSQTGDPAVPALENRLGDLETRVTDSGDAASSGLSGLGTRVEELEGAVAELSNAPAVDPAAFEALSARVEELANAITAVSAGASGADATQIGSDIATLQSELEASAQTVAGLEPAVQDLTGQLADQDARIAELEAAFADQPEVEDIAAERDRFAQLPGLVARLETAIAAGEPFAETLAALETALPELEIGEAARAASATGVAAPDTIAAALRAAMPDLLAARPRDPNAGALESLTRQVQSALALRPAGDVAGDTPDARLARAEAALENGDLATAQSALSALPGPMRDAAAPILEDINTALAAQSLLEAARDAGANTAEAGQ